MSAASEGHFTEAGAYVKVLSAVTPPTLEIFSSGGPEKVLDAA